MRSNPYRPITPVDHAWGVTQPHVAGVGPYFKNVAPSYSSKIASDS